MNLQICCVRDRAVDAYSTPFFVPSIGFAIRSFSDELNKAGTALCDHPDDYDLYHIGEFDPTSGQIVPCDRPRMVAVGKEHKTLKES